MNAFTVSMYSINGSSKPPEENQDRFHHTTIVPATHARPAVYAYGIADGHGTFGDVAAQRSLELLSERFTNTIKENRWKTPEEILHSVVTFVGEQAHALTEGTRSGACLEYVLASETGAYALIHAGDTRTHHVAANGLPTLLTEDHAAFFVLGAQPPHSYDFKLVHDSVKGTPEAFGHESIPRYDILWGKLTPGEALVLATDGVTSSVHIDEMAQLLYGINPAEAITIRARNPQQVRDVLAKYLPEEKVRREIEKRAGTDDMTCMTIRYEGNHE